MLRSVYHFLARGTARFRYTTPLSEYHSTPQTISHAGMKVKIIPALDDNYMYLVIDEKCNTAAAVDPVQPDKIIDSAAEANVNISSVLTTHHHWDHAGGNKEIAQKISNLVVYGGDERIDALTVKVEHNTEFKIGSLSVRCLFTPCHTSGHICYLVSSEGEDSIVFTGDTLFVGGCGKFFEGQPQQMCKALVDILGNLPENTKVFCGHEYTLSNLKYAMHVENDNPDLLRKMEWAKEQRSKGLPTVPSTIKEELSYNPFMRVQVKNVQNHANAKSSVEAMEFLRNEKNAFKPKY